MGGLWRARAAGGPTVRGVPDEHPPPTVRPWRDGDDPAFAALVAAHLADDAGWPPPSRRTGDLAAWFAAPCDLARLVAVTGRPVGGGIVGHVGVHHVADPGAVAVWRAAIHPDGDYAEIVRGLVHPDWRGSGVVGALTGAAVDWAVAGGRIPVATALSDRRRAVGMLARYGWRSVARQPSATRPELDLVWYAPPPAVVARALRRAAAR
jgi:GNAT superfamily N-acetyltransferase